MSPFVVVMGFMVVLGGIGVVAAFLPKPSRTCPECEGPVPLTAKRCIACGYRFGPDGRDRYVR